MAQGTLGKLNGSLTAVGWSKQSQPDKRESAKLDALYNSGWGVLGVIVCEDSADVVRRWAGAQARLGNLKGRDKLGIWRDYYLLILVQAIRPPDWRDLRDIIGDTHVCRKICEVIENRSVQSIVDRSPVLNLHWAESPAIEGVAMNPYAPGISGIPSKLADDLARRRAEVILERLLTGDYNGEDVDET